MTQIIKLKSSSTPSSVPDTTDLIAGEAAVNSYDGKMYIKKDDGLEEVVQVGGLDKGNEVITLTAGQVNVTTTLSIADSDIYIRGVDTINGLLVETVDYTVVNDNNLTLTNSEPADTKLVLVSISN